MAALVALEEAVRGTASLTLREYEHWGEYDGPLVEGGASSDGGGHLANGPPRMVRDETFLEAEEAELAALDEASEERRHLTAALGSARVPPGVSTCSALSLADSNEADADRDAVATTATSARPRRIDDAHKDAVATSARPKRISLTRQDRKAQAAVASSEARRARRLSMLGSSSGLAAAVRRLVLVLSLGHHGSAAADGRRVYGAVVEADGGAQAAAEGGGAQGGKKRKKAAKAKPKKEKNTPKSKGAKVTPS